MKRKRTGKGLAVFTSLALSACMLGAIPASADMASAESIVDASQQAFVQSAIDAYFESEQCTLGAKSDYTYSDTYAVCGIASLTPIADAYQTLVFQADTLIGKLVVHGDEVTYRAMDAYDAQATQEAMQSPDFMICSGTNYWVNERLSYDLIYANGMVNDLTANEMLGDYASLHIQKYISGTVSQNGNNTIATDEQRQHIEANIQAYNQNQTTPLADGYLSYSYCVVSATDMEPISENSYVTFLIVNNEAVGYFKCDAVENAECSYVPMMDNDFVDAMYSDRAYQILSGETCKIGGVSHRLMLYFEGVLSDLETGETIYTGDWDGLQIEPDNTVCDTAQQAFVQSAIDDYFISERCALGEKSDYVFSEAYAVYALHSMEAMENVAYVLVSQNNAYLGYFMIYSNEYTGTGYAQFNDVVPELLTKAVENNQNFMLGASDGYWINGKLRHTIILDDGVYDLETNERLGNKPSELDYVLYQESMPEEDDHDTTIVTDAESENTTTLCGDINQDNNVDLIDAVLLQKIVNGTVVLNATQVPVADCNADDAVDGGDAMTLMGFLLRQVDTLPYSNTSAQS